MRKVGRKEGNEEQDEVSKLIKETVDQDPEFVEKNMAFLESLRAVASVPAPEPVKPRTGFRPVQYKPKPKPAGAPKKVIVEEIEVVREPVVEDLGALVKEISARVGFSPQVKDIDILRSVRAKRESERTRVMYETLEEFYSSVDKLVRNLAGSESDEVMKVTRGLFARIVWECSKARVNGRVLLSSNYRPRAYGSIPMFRDLVRECLLREERGQGLSRTTVLRKIGRNHVMYYDVADNVFRGLEEEGFIEKRKRRFFLSKKDSSTKGKD